MRCRAVGRRSSPLRQPSTNVSASSGSNWEPAQRSSSASACSTAERRAVRPQSDVIASKASATPRMRASTGISSPAELMPGSRRRPSARGGGERTATRARSRRQPSIEPRTGDRMRPDLRELGFVERARACGAPLRRRRASRRRGASRRAGASSRRSPRQPSVARETLRDRASRGPSARGAADPEPRGRPRRWRAVTPQCPTFQSGRRFPSSPSPRAVECDLREGRCPERDRRRRAPGRARARAVGKLASSGFTFVVETRRRAPPQASRTTTTRRRARRRGARAVLLAAAGAVVRVGRPTADEVAELEPGTVLIGFLAPLTDPEGIERLAARGRRRVRDGVDPAHHARAVDGRALLAGTVAGLQGGAARRRPAAAPVSAADDRRRARSRRRRCSCSAPASRDCRRSRPRGASARSCRASTSAPPCASRSRASAPRSSTSASPARRPRAATRRS